jgi:hypothetical protein
MAQLDRWLVRACIAGVLGCWLVIALTMGGCGSEHYDGAGNCSIEIAGDNNDVDAEQNCQETGGDGGQDNTEDNSTSTTNNEGPHE